jgi:hypothetical protein
MSGRLTTRENNERTKQQAGSSGLVFSRVSPSGATRVSYFDGLRGPTIEAKFGDMGQWFNLERQRHAFRQST